jgi:hypothetical protein
MEGKPLFRSRLAVTLKHASIGKPIRHHLWSKLHCLIFKYECCWTSESVVADSFSKARESACQRYRWVKTQNVSSCNVAWGQQSRNYQVFCVCKQMDGHVDTCVCLSARCTSISVVLDEIWYAWFTSIAVTNHRAIRCVFKISGVKPLGFAPWMLIGYR